MDKQESFENGRIAEAKWESVLLWYQIHYWRVGQENWLPNWIHRKIAYKYDDDVEIIRHFPDFATNKALISIKHAPDCDEYPTVTIEHSSFNISKRFYELGIPTMIIYLFPDKRFYGNFVEKIKIETPSISRHESNGSHTPFYLIRKSDLENIHDGLLDYLRE